MRHKYAARLSRRQFLRLSLSLSLSSCLLQASGETIIPLLCHDRFVNIGKEEECKGSNKNIKPFRSFGVVAKQQERGHMEFSEKYLFAEKKPMYDTIPLIILDKVKKEHSKSL